jgi:succinate dehydrogenase / fumarate reductase flavoprotein subunit
VLLASGGYGNVFYLSTNAMGSNVTAPGRRIKGRLFRQSLFTQIHPTCIPVTGDHQSKLTLMSESLRNDGRIWVPKQKNDPRKPGEIPKKKGTTTWKEDIRPLATWCPVTWLPGPRKERCDAGYGVGTSKQAVYLDFASAIERYGKTECRKHGIDNPTAEEIRHHGVEVVKEKYGNLFDMYAKITGEDPLYDADAHLSRRPLYDGRALGRL